MLTTDKGDEDFQTPHDKLLRTLIFEHEKKLGEEARPEVTELRNLQHVT